jgi:branched-chain amino acid transport system substrate-binding protein
MKLIHRIRLFVSAHALIAFAFGGAAQAQAPIKIGASLSTTGSFAVLGQNLLRGYQLCVKQANEKGGVLGRKLELVVEDDQSQTTTAVRIYEKLITQDKVHAILGPLGSPNTDAVANVSEKYKMPMLAYAGATSIFKKGRKFVFMVLPPAEVFLDGLIDIAAMRGLKTVAIIGGDNITSKAMAQGAAELARKRGLQVVLVEAYANGTTDFGALLNRVRAANPDVIAAATFFEDAVGISRQLKESNVNPKMFGVTIGGDLPKFRSTLGSTAEFVYGATPWEAELVTLRAGGLIPVAREYPGASEFVESHKKEFPGADLSYQSAAGYAMCQILIEATRRAGAVDSAKIREAILKMDINTVFGAFRVDSNGVQIGHKMLLLQWQDGKKAIVWPEELAADKPRFPMPEWSKRP